MKIWGRPQRKGEEILTQPKAKIRTAGYPVLMHPWRARVREALYVLFGLWLVLGFVEPPATRAFHLKSGAGPVGDPDLPKKSEVRELAPGVFQFIKANGSWNSGFIITSAGVAVVDAMLTPAWAHRVREKIRERTDKPIQYLLITHRHSDHYFGAQVFVPPAELIAHASVREHYTKNVKREFAFRRRISPKADLSEVVVRLPSITVEGPRTRLYLGDTEIQLLYFGPGQTPGALFIYLPKEKVMYTGDTFNRKSINFMANATSIEGWLSILDKIKAMDVKVYAGGHGIPAVKSDIDGAKRFIRAMVNGVKGAIADGLTVNQAVQKLTFPEFRQWRNYDRFIHRNIKGLYKRFQKKGG